MIILLRKSLLLICVILISLAVLFVCAPKDKLSYYSEITSKMRRLELTPSPKIILVGGSNLTFGIDSKRIEREFHQPVVNMSLHAGLGLDYMLNQLSGRIRSGDTILISPEYEHFSKGYSCDSDAIFSLILNNKNVYCLDFSPYTLISHGSAFGPYLLLQYINSFDSINHGVYTVSNFDEYGDMVGHLKLKRESFSHGEKSTPNVSSDSDFDRDKVKLINDFTENMISAGANTYIMYPVISSTGYYNNEILNNEVATAISTLLLPRVLSNNIKYVFQDDYFFNSVYHLDKEGRDLRTSYVIDDLHRVGFNTHARK